MTNNEISIRTENKADFPAVEELTRRAFYNLYVPGCNEHYLVHIMRAHKDFIPELALVIEAGGKIIGNIMYTKARLVDDSHKAKDIAAKNFAAKDIATIDITAKNSAAKDIAAKNILTFGPVCIAPEYQRRGYGKRLMEYSFAQAVKLGYDTIVIFGDPANYVGRGFVSCQKYNICIETGQFPTAMMVKELKPQVFDGRKWIYCESPVMQLDLEAAKRFDDRCPPMGKEWRPSQESFYILSQSFVHPEEKAVEQ